jgi:hypothetical protein
MRSLIRPRYLTDALEFAAESDDPFWTEDNVARCDVALDYDGWVADVDLYASEAQFNRTAWSTEPYVIESANRNHSDQLADWTSKLKSAGVFSSLPPAPAPVKSPGSIGDLAPNIVASPTSPAPLPPSTPASPSSPGPSNIREVQTTIGAAPDGIWGPESTAKLKIWQASHGLPQTGRLDEATLAALAGPSPMSSSGSSTGLILAGVGVAAVIGAFFLLRKKS